MWNPLKENSKPNKLDEVFVKTLSGQIFYAIYLGNDRFDVRQEADKTKGTSWVQHTNRTIIEWMYLDEVIGILKNNH